MEDKSSGTQLIQELKAAGQYRVKPYAPPQQTDKVMRLHSQTAKFEGGYDDQVDSTAQALDYMHNNNSLDVWNRLGRGY